MFHSCLNMGKNFQKHISAEKKAGATCYKNAIWVGVEKYYHILNFAIQANINFQKSYQS